MPVRTLRKPFLGLVTPSEGDSGRVDLRAARKPRGVLPAVHDTGIGPVNVRWWVALLPATYSTGEGLVSSVSVVLKMNISLASAASTN